MSWKLSAVLFALISMSIANYLDFSNCPGEPTLVDGPLQVFSEMCKRRSVSLATGSNICNLTDVKIFQVVFNVIEISPGFTSNVSVTKFGKSAQLAHRIYLPITVETASIDVDLNNEKDFNGTELNHQFHRYIILNIDVEGLAIPEERYNYVFRGIYKFVHLKAFQLQNYFQLTSTTLLKQISCAHILKF